MLAIPEYIKCLIIGSGPAGYTAAIYAARAGLEPVMYTGMLPGGQLTQTTEVENFPGYPLGVLGPNLMEDLRRQALRFGAEIRTGYVTGVDFSASPHQVIIDDEVTVLADAVIISTGASAKWLGLESELKYQGYGVSGCAVCDGYFFKNRDVAVVGAGDTAAEEATYLAKLARKVYMLVRRDAFRASKHMVERIESAYNIEVLFNTETVEVLGDGAKVTGVQVRNVKSGKIDSLPISGLFVAIGHQPNTDVFRGSVPMDSEGYIRTIPGSTKTSIPGIFCAGDAQDRHYRQAVTAAGTGCMAALDAERYLASRDMEIWKQLRTRM